MAHVVVARTGYEAMTGRLAAPYTGPCRRGGREREFVPSTEYNDVSATCGEMVIVRVWPLNRTSAN
jgi:hypothetical protein